MMLPDRLPEASTQRSPSMQPVKTEIFARLTYSIDNIQSIHQKNYECFCFRPLHLQSHRNLRIIIIFTITAIMRIVNVKIGEIFIKKLF